ncbi:hypothetical protein TWF506_011131 [Arthrobotrys conoides]|uniref:Uncharacterized protein n=1 Tax=Arthrobotrys conoides TaxID=74498 RepID=A0AAN8NQ36_9PEZI
MLTYQTPELGEPHPKSVLVVKAECLVSQNLPRPALPRLVVPLQTKVQGHAPEEVILASPGAQAHEFGIGFRHRGRRIATMPNIPYNHGMNNANDQNGPGTSSANIVPPAMQGRRMASFEEFFSDGPANPPAPDIRPTRSTPRIPYFGHGEARGFESHNALQGIPETGLGSPAAGYQLRYPIVTPLGPPQVIPLGPQVGLPYNPPGFEDTVLMRHAANHAVGLPGPSGSSGHLQVPNHDYQGVTQTLRNFRLYDEYEQAARQLSGGPYALRQRSAPNISAVHGALGPEIQRHAMSLRYAIDPTGQLIRTPVREPVGLHEAGTGFHQTNGVGSQQGTNFATTQRGVSNPNFTTFAGRRSYNEMPQRQATRRTDASESPRQNVFQRSSPREGDFPVISFTSTDTNENDENDGILRNPH